MPVSIVAEPPLGTVTLQYGRLLAQVSEWVDELVLPLASLAITVACIVWPT